MRNQLLEERSWLQFEFPPQVDAKRYKLPFFENPIIRESKKAKLASYSPFSRSSPLFSYLGAEARTFEVSFNITYDHIMALGGTYTGLKEITEIISNSTVETKEKLRALFFEENQELRSIPGSARPFISRYTQILSKNLGRVDGEIDALGALVTLPNSREVSEEQSLFDIAIFGADRGSSDIRRRRNIDPSFIRGLDLVMFYVNLIRVSVVNNSEVPSLGPPIIRLNHGIMYQGVPTICSDYRIEYEDEPGYEVNTLLPRRLNIRLTLMEVRAGDFGKYDPKSIIKGDNIAGWEVLIENTETATMDSRPEGMLRPIITPDFL